MSVGAASTAVITWLEEMQIGAKMEELPELFVIITGYALNLSFDLFLVLFILHWMYAFCMV